MAAPLATTPDLLFTSWKGGTLALYPDKDTRDHILTWPRTSSGTAIHVQIEDPAGNVLWEGDKEVAELQGGCKEFRGQRIPDYIRLHGGISWPTRKTHKYKARHIGGSVIRLR